MRVFALVTVLALLGCAATVPPSPQPDWQAEADVQDRLRRQQAEAELAASRTPASVVLPRVPEVLPDEPPIKNPSASIARANGKALVTPRPEWFARGTLYFPYRAGALYQVITSVNQPTTFVFPPDELLLKYVGLEGKERWTVFQGDLDDGGTKQSILTVIPNEVNLTGGLTLVTSKTFYNLQLKSQEPTGVLEVRWRHPEAQMGADKAHQPASGSQIWHVGYTITPEHGAPTWTPLLVYDTGLQGKTIIQFSDGIELMNAPLVFVPNAAGALEQVNYRKRGHRYIIDLVAPRFELRLGVDDAAEIVSITRDKRYRAIRCPGSADCPKEGA
jgi:type IV secretory pathway VirB9-like protein